MAKSVLIEVVIRLREPLNLGDAFRALYKSLIGREPPAQPIEGPFAINFRIRGQVLVEPMVLGVRIFDDLPPDGQLRELREVWSRIEHVTDVLNVGEYVFSSQWVDSFEGTWERLVDFYCQAFFTADGRAPGARDVSILADFRGPDWTANMQTGPMERAQLEAINSGLTWPAEVVRDRFLYLAYAYRSSGIPRGIDGFVTEGLKNAMALVDHQTNRFSKVTT